MYRNVANWASSLIHPLFAPVFLYAIVFFVFPKLAPDVAIHYKLFYLLVIAFVTGGLPALSIYMLYKAGMVSDLHLFHRKDRHLPMLIACIIYAAASYVFINYLEAQGLFLIIIIIIASSVIVLTAITTVFKISVHVTAFSGVMGFMWGLHQRFPNEVSFVMVMIGVLCTGIIMSSRLYLNAHTDKQVWAGLTLGILISTLGMLILDINYQ